MILYPAIDIRDGRAVRLTQGDYRRETAYDADPVDAAVRWAGEGAEFLHVVDLDGAKAGAPRNLEVVRQVVKSVATRCSVQVGGGLRTDESVAAVLEAGAARAVIGTAALSDPDFLQAMINAYADRVVVSVDARDGKAMLAGWTESSELDVADAVADLTRRGVERFLCTAIEVDGTMEGPALDELKRIAFATGARIIASGGVGDLTHLEALAREMPANVEGVIVGRALYERRFAVADAIAALRDGRL